MKTIAFSERIYFNKLSKQDAETIQKDLKTFNSMVHSAYKILYQNDLHKKSFSKDEIVKTLATRYNTNYYFPWNALTQAKQTLSLNQEINQRLRKTLSRQIRQAQKRLTKNIERLSNLTMIHDSLIDISKAKFKKIPPPPLINYHTMNATWIPAQADSITINQQTMNLYLFEVNLLQPEIKRIRCENKSLRGKINALKDKLKNTIKHIKPIRFGGLKQMKLRTTKKLNHDQWLKRYQANRNKNMLIAGTKNHQYGNALFQYNSQNHLMTYLGQNNHLVKFPIRFKYKENELRQKLSLQSGTFNKNIAYHLENHGEYFLIKAIMDLTVDQRFFMSDTSIGTIGLDINVKHFALTEIDSKGNIVRIKKIKYDVSNKTNHQRTHILREKAKDIINFCNQSNKVLVIENLNFEETKLHMSYDASKKLKKCIHEFAYRSIIQAITSRALKCKIKTYQISPAYTSVIGYLKYSKEKGLSSHFSAAYVIARRGKGLKEKINKKYRVMLSEKQKKQPYDKQWADIYKVICIHP